MSSMDLVHGVTVRVVVFCVYERITMECYRLDMCTSDKQKL